MIVGVWALAVRAPNVDKDLRGFAIDFEGVRLSVSFERLWSLESCSNNLSIRNLGVVKVSLSEGALCKVLPVRTVMKGELGWRVERVDEKGE